eukprot:PhF_6_TR15621/c0_g1_i1/m.24238
MSSTEGTVIPPPTFVGKGKKVYRIRNSNFEVDVRYDVIKAIGYGAYGFVCSAKDTVTGEYVAIKKIPKIFDDLIDGKRILRECKLLPFLNHENIMSMKDLMRPREGYPNYKDLYLVSELMETDLHQVIRSKQPLSEEHIQYFSFQMFRALKYMHSAGVLHRDLKPGNLLVNSNCDLKICDFGLARGGLQDVRKPQELTDYVITRWYRPPELLLMCHYSQAADVWSAGLILIELFNRKPAMPGKDYIHQLTLITDILGTPTEEDLTFITSTEANTYLRSIGKKPKRSFTSLLPKASRQLLDLITGCLQFNPNKRWTAAHILQHPYYAHLYDPQDETDFEPKPGFEVDWDFDYHDVSEPELRELFWQEILKYHPSEPAE